MAIKKAGAKNFQSHEDSNLEFSEYMNVLFGPSDNGKSAFLRSMYWVITNRPSGEKFRRHETKSTSCTITTDEGSVRRFKSDKKNEYRIKGKKDPYSALNRSIPEDVSSALNISEVNIQSQEDVHFLINISPGKVSKKLNEVAGLEVMDTVLKSVNSKVRSVTAEVNATHKDRVKIQQELFELEWVNDADTALKGLEALHKALEDTKGLFHRVSEIISDIKELEKERSKFLSNELIGSLDEIIELADKINALTKKYDNTTSLISDISKLGKELSAMSVIDLEEIENMHISLVSERNAYKRVCGHVAAIKLLKQEHIDASDLLTQTEKDYSEELKSIGICPTCGKKV